MPDQMFVVKPTPDYLRNKMDSVKQVARQGMQTYVMEDIVCPESGGTFVYYRGMLHPEKCMPYDEMVWAVNCAKKITLSYAFIFANPIFVPSLALFAVLPKKLKTKFIEKCLEWYTHTADYLLFSFYPEKKYMCKMALGMGYLVTSFLLNLGIRKDICEIVGNVIAMIFEGDNAYRYRVQDWATELIKEALIINPSKELRRVFLIAIERENGGIKGKWKAFSHVITAIFLLPYFKKAFIATIKDFDLSSIQLDEADKYWCLQRSDYQFFGVPFEERMEQFRQLHGGTLPKGMTVRMV